MPSKSVDPIFSPYQSDTSSRKFGCCLKYLLKMTTIISISTLRSSIEAQNQIHTSVSFLQRSSKSVNSNLPISILQKQWHTQHTKTAINLWYQFIQSFFFQNAFSLDVLKVVYLSPVFLPFLIKKKKIEWYFNVKNIEVTEW